MREILSSLAPEGFITQGREDIHVHTEHCDDASYPVFGAVRDSARRNLRWVNLTRHVRADTPVEDVQRFVEDVRRHGDQFTFETGIMVTLSVETKMADGNGTLDIPEGVAELVDFLLIADHQMPYRDGVLTPSEIVSRCEKGDMLVEEAVEGLFAAYTATVQANPGNILAHPFSVLPKIGVNPDRVHPDLWKEWAKNTRENMCAVDVNSKWVSPPRSAFPHLIAEGVPLLSGSDVHHAPASFAEFTQLTSYRPLTVVTGEGYETPVFRGSSA